MRKKAIVVFFLNLFRSAANEQLVFFYIPIVNIPYVLYFEIAPTNNQTVEFLETLQINKNYVNDIWYKKTVAIEAFYRKKIFKKLDFLL